MPWEITIRRADDLPLGELESVKQQILSAVPSVQFYREPSGLEKIATARERGVEFPDVIRESMEQLPATDQAEYEGNEIFFRMYGFNKQPLNSICMEFRGSGNPTPILASLCNTTGWIAIDDASSQPIDLTDGHAEGWKSFRSYVSRVMRRIRRL